MIDRFDGVMNRRNLLKTAGAAAAAVAMPGTLARAAEVAAADLRAKAKKNLKLGIFTGVYGGLPVDEAARRIREDGFSCVVPQYAFKDVGFDPLNPDWNAVKRMRAAFEKNDLQIVGLYGYHNVIGPDAASKKRNEQFISTIINNWQKLGAPIISTETGTFNEKSQFAEDPKNFTEEGYKAGLEAFTKLARAAEKAKAVIAIEGYWKNLIGSVDRAERLFKDVDSPALKLTMDPCNYYRNEDLPRMDEIMRDMFKRIGKQTVLAHAKDVKAKEDGGQDLPASGLGVLNYPLYLRLLAELDRPMPLIIEHLTIDDVPRARDYVKAQFEKL